MEGIYTHSGTSGLFDRPYLCLRGIPSKPPLTTPNDLAGAFAYNPERQTAFFAEEHKLSQAPICGLTYHQFASQIGLGHVKLARSVCSNSEIFFTSPNFLLTALLACGLLAKIITLLDFNELGHYCQAYNKYEVIKR